MLKSVKRPGWVKNTSGKKDAMLTFSLIAFIVVILKFLFAGVIISIGTHSLTFGTADSAAIAAVLTPTFGAYVARRFSDRNTPQQTDEELSPAAQKVAGE